jgi:hypothetical protein
MPDSATGSEKNWEMKSVQPRARVMAQVPAPRWVAD